MIVPYLEVKEDVVEESSYSNFDANWVLFSRELNIYQFFSSNQECQDNKIRSIEHNRPIFLIHGYNSSHLTWNWMAQRLWDNGFWNIFAIEFFSCTEGLQRLFDQINRAIEHIFTISSTFQFITVIGHSLGGWMARYYLKREKNDNPKVRLCVTLGSPHYGVFSVLEPLKNQIVKIIKRYWPSKIDLLRNFSPNGKRMMKINNTLQETDVYMTTMVNITGSMPLLGGTDGLFKSQPISDMINLNVPATHFTVNKNEISFQIIKNLLLNRVGVFKLRLLYIEALKTDVVLKKDYYFKIHHHNKQVQRYPISSYIELNGQMFISTRPLIAYVGMSNKSNSEWIRIEVFQKNTFRKDTMIIDQKIEVPFSTSNISMKTAVITTPKDHIQFVFALMSYNLKYTGYDC